MEDTFTIHEIMKDGRVRVTFHLIFGDKTEHYTHVLPNATQAAINNAASNPLLQAALPTLPLGTLPVNDPGLLQAALNTFAKNFKSAIITQKGFQVAVHPAVLGMKDQDFTVS